MVLLGIIEDFYFIIQIFILLSVMSFVFNHYGKNGWSYVIIAIMCYLVFFVIPGLSFGIFMIQLLLGAGVSSLLVDFFFLTQNPMGHAQPGKEGQHAAASGPEKADDTGLGVMERVRKAQHGHEHHAAHAVHQMMRGRGGG